MNLPMSSVPAYEPVPQQAATGRPPSSREPGPQLATFGRSRSFVGAIAALALLFIAVGALLFWLHGRVVAHAINFTGDPKVLTLAGAGALAIGLGAMTLAWWRTRHQMTFFLHEHALRAVGAGRDQLDFFEDIEDIYRSGTTGVFGWRRTPGMPWITVDNRVSHFSRLYDELAGRHIAQRGELLWNRLQTGGGVTFHLFPAGAAQGLIWWRSGNVDHPVTPITLTARELTIGGKTIAVARLRPIDRSAWHETIKFVSVDGEEIFRTTANAILSLALLLTLIEELQRPAG